MIRHRHDEPEFESAADVPAADATEQHQPIDPVTLAETTTLPAEFPAEADPADVAEQTEAIAFDDELRAENPTSPSRPDPQPE